MKIKHDYLHKDHHVNEDLDFKKELLAGLIIAGICIFFAILFCLFSYNKEGL